MRSFKLDQIEEFGRISGNHIFELQLLPQLFVRF
jgi:hypothetical protein